MEENLPQNSSLGEVKAGRDLPFAPVTSLKNLVIAGKAVLLVPYLLFLMTGLKVIDKKDQLQKKGSKRYYF